MRTSQRIDTEIPLQYKGDLLVHDGQDLNRLGVSTDTHVLTLDSTQTLGVKWAAGGSGGTPGGSTTQIQYNNAGAFGGTAGFTWNGTNLQLTAAQELQFRATTQRIYSSAASTLDVDAATSTNFRIGGTTYFSILAGEWNMLNGVLFSWGNAAVAFTGDSATGDLYINAPETHLQNIKILDSGLNHEYIVAPSNLAADRTVTLPLLTGNDTFVFEAHTQTLTNKTINASQLINATVTVAKIANGTDGELITWDAAGVAATVAAGTSGHVLTSNGAGAAPTFQAAAGGGAPTDADYVVKTAHASLSAERVLTDVSRSGIKADWGTASQLKLSATSMLFITSITGAGVSNLNYAAGTNPANKVVSDVDSDLAAITVFVEVDAGPLGGTGQGWQPVVTINGGDAPVVVTNLVAVTSTRRFTGSAAITATSDGTLYATADDGGRSQDVSYDRVTPPLVLTAVWDGVYPTTAPTGLQTAVRNTQTLRITGTQDASATAIRVNAISGTCAQQDFAVSGTTFDISITISGGTSAAGKFFTLKATAGGGTYGATINTTATFEIDVAQHAYSSFVTSAFAGTNFALKAADTCTGTMTISNWDAGGDTITYSSSDVDATAPTTYAAGKTYTCKSPPASSYLASGTNVTISTQRKKNGLASSTTGLVKIANVAPTLALTGATSRLRSRAVGGDKTYALLITGSQELKNTVTCVRDSAGTVDNGPALAAWTGSAPDTTWTNTLTAQEDDTKNTGATNFVWEGILATNGAGTTVAAIGTNPNYTVGGFEQRDIALARFSEYGAIGTTVSNLNNATKLVCSCVETGTTLTYVGSVTPTTNGFTITNSGGTFSATGNYVRCLDGNIYNNIPYTLRIEELV